MSDADPRPFTLGGFAVRLAARRPDGKLLVALLDRQGRLTGDYREAEIFQLRRIGTHMAALKRLAAALPLASFPFDSPPAVTPQTAAGSGGACPHPIQGVAGFLHAHHALPAGDR